ncbi:hypothetical protein SUGI_0985870 [Cryptomeria japonica]|nr:hypothetical protein SUGI_0985870 [Cryptomeria japonica]
MDMIASTLFDNEYVEVQDLKTTYEMWNKLKNVYGGDPYVQKDKELEPLGTINVTLDSLIGKLIVFELSNYDNSMPKIDVAFKSSMTLAPTMRRKETRSSSTARTVHSYEHDSLLSEEQEQDELEALIARRLPRGKGKYREEGVTDEESEGSGGEGIAFVVAKEDSTEESDMALISSSNRCGDWVIDSGCTHHMTGDRNKFLGMENCDGGLVRFDNDAPCEVKGKGSIALNDKTNCEDVYWVEGLKYSLLSVAQLNNKGYWLEFNEGICKITDKSGGLIATGKQTKETFAPVARLEGVRIFLAYVAYRKFKVYQMDVKSTFLNGVLEEEVYIEKPKGFASEDGRDMVCKLKKAMYGLK